MFPLRNRKLIRGCAAHKKAGLSCGADYEAVNIPFYIPFGGKVETYRGPEGGNWLRLIRDDNGDKIEMAHLSAYEIRSGHAREGQLGGITGNTGAITTGPHLHIQIIDKAGNRLDPETYNWNSMTFPIKMPLTIVANKIAWATLQQQVGTLAEWFNHYSAGKLQPAFDIVHTSFKTIPFSDFQSGLAPDVNWYRQNITPLTRGVGTILLVPNDQWQAPTGGYTWGWMTYGDPGRPVRMQLTAVETEMNGVQGRYDYAPIFIHRAFHEICHMIPFLTGQPDRVHEFLLVDEDKKAELLALTDYAKLQIALNNIKPMPKIKIRSIGWNDPEKGLYFPFDTMERRQAVLDKLTGLFPDYELDPTEYNLKIRPWK